MVLTVSVAGALWWTSPAAWAVQALTDREIGLQCAVQYPGGAGYSDGVAYLAPPGNANSWRCKQVSDPPGGGAITDLAVDLGASCRQFAGGGAPWASDGADAFSWTCG